VEFSVERWVQKHFENIHSLDIQENQPSYEWKALRGQHFADGRAG